MRRFILIFLMMLLPLQSVWSAAAAACTHESETTTRHFGHHQAHHDNDASGMSNTAGSDADHHHLLGVNPVPSMPALPAVAVSGAVTRPHTADRYASTLVAGPERPPKSLAEILSARSIRWRSPQFL